MYWNIHYSNKEGQNLHASSTCNENAVSESIRRHLGGLEDDNTE